MSACSGKAYEIGRRVGGDGVVMQTSVAVVVGQCVRWGGVAVVVGQGVREVGTLGGCAVVRQT